MKETYLCVSSIDAFKDAVFQHIVSEANEFSLKDIDPLLKLVHKLEFENQKNYKIEFSRQLFTFKAVKLA